MSRNRKRNELIFIYIEKVFDRFKWDKVIEIIKEKRVDWKNGRLIKELCKRQKTVVKVNENLIDWVEMSRGVRQCCCLLPTLFNFYIEDMLSNTLEDEERIHIGRQKINCIRFANNMVILAKALQKLLVKLEEGINEYRMKRM